MTQNDTSAVGVQAPRPIQSKETRALLDLRRELESAVAVCDYAIQSHDAGEQRAAIKIVKADVWRLCK